MLLKRSLQEIKDAAAKGSLTWQGKKVILDPFLKIHFYYEIEKLGEDEFSLSPHIRVGERQESCKKYELLTELGALQGGTFRLWDNPDQFEQHPEKVSGKQLEKLIKEGLSHRFKGDAPRIKPAPLPILRLKDRSGGFALLFMDYGPWGEEPFHNANEEERHWERDLLESGYQRRGLEYYCPLNQVVKTISFLLDIGWTVFDFRNKRVVKQNGIVYEVEEMQNALLLKGRAKFGDQEHVVQDAGERWIDLSPHEVGLLELPKEWQDLDEEEKTPTGIKVRKSHMGLVTAIVPDFKPAPWEEKAPGEAFHGILYPYQQKGVEWLWFLYRAGFSGLLADEMGLGKTIQVLAFLSLRQGRVLIVMPLTLISLWREQIKKFLPGLNVYVHQGSVRGTHLPDDAIILTSYSTLRVDAQLFNGIEFDTIVLDEAHMIKNRETQIAQTVFQLKSVFRIALTGTPIENRAEELNSLFHFLMPGLQTDYKRLRPFILRRTKDEAGLDLPEKIVQVIGVDPSDEEQALYETLLRTKKTDLMQKMEVLELILRMRQLACHPALLDPSYTGEVRKFEQVMQDLSEVVESRHKVLLYSQFTSVLQLFRKQFEAKEWRFVYLDGSTQDRETPVQEFQTNPEISIFLISLKAGGVGLNLQAADYVFLYDPWWNSAVEHQAIDRAHRVGRKKTVIARKYFTQQTIEAKILKLQEKKAELAEGLWEEEETISYDEMLALLT